MSNLNNNEKSSPDRDIKKKVSKTLLIVEDDRKLLGYYISTSKDYFQNIISCTSCLEARKILEEKHIDAALIDYVLPDGDGLTLIDSINPRSEKIPVVLITGNSNKNMAIEALNLGICHFIEKPVSKNSLRNTLNMMLDLMTEKDMISHVTSKFDLNPGTISHLKEKYQITNRELEIIKLALTKDDNQSIARALFISPMTVKTHFQNIFFKLSISSRKELSDLVFKENIKHKS